MKELQTVALGLLVIIVDIGSPDWIADPLGWLLVLVGIAAARDRLTDYGYLALTAWVCLALSVVTWPPESVPHLDSTLAWMFSIPTLAFCFMLSDSLTDVTRPDLAQRFRAICWAYAVIIVLPLVVILMEWDSLQTPAAILAIVVNVVLVLSLFSASDEDALLAEDEEAAESRTGAATTKDSKSGRSQDDRSGADKVASAARSAKGAAKDAVGNVTETVKEGAAGTAASAKGTAKDVTGKVKASTSRSGSSGDGTDADDDEGKHKA